MQQQDNHEYPFLYQMFFFNETPPTEIYTLSLHDALPIFMEAGYILNRQHPPQIFGQVELKYEVEEKPDKIRRDVENYAKGVSDLLVKHKVILADDKDRKSTRLNSSHRTISYAVFCLKKKK